MDVTDLLDGIHTAMIMWYVVCYNDYKTVWCEQLPYYYNHQDSCSEKISVSFNGEISCLLEL